VQEVLGEVIKQYDINAGVVTVKDQNGNFEVLHTLGLEHILGEYNDLDCLHSSSLCKLLVHRKMPVIIENVPELPQWKDDPLIKASCRKLVFYVEVALINPQGQFCGSLCLLHGDQKQINMQDCHHLVQQAAKLGDIIMEAQVEGGSTTASEHSASSEQGSSSSSTLLSLQVLGDSTAVSEHSTSCE